VLWFHKFTYLQISTVAKLGICLAWHVQPETEEDSKPRGNWKEREREREQKLALSCKKTDAVAAVPKTFPRLEV